MAKSHCNNRPVQPWPSCPVNGRTKEHKAQRHWSVYGESSGSSCFSLHACCTGGNESLERGKEVAYSLSSLVLWLYRPLSCCECSSLQAAFTKAECLRAALSASLKLWSGGRWGGKSSVEDHRSSRLRSWHCHRSGKNKSKTIEAALLPVKTNYHKISPVNKLMASCLQRKAGQRFTLIITCLLYRYWQY